MISFFKKRTSGECDNGRLVDIHSYLSMKESKFRVLFENSDNDLDNKWVKFG